MQESTYRPKVSHKEVIAAADSFTYIHVNKQYPGKRINIKHFINKKHAA
jgi:hypothetical protein